MENVLVRTSAPRTDLPARSRLYGLAPEGVGTPVVECLTSYINRLAWLYRISPRILVAEEIIPHLSKSYYFQSSPRDLSAFCHQEAIGINSFGETPVDWSATIEGLTQLDGLQKLTLGKWASGIPSRHLFRVAPAWCSACYTDWQEKKLPIYQPLIWMLQSVTSCTQHKRKLEEQCNHCQKRQVVFPSMTQPGHCTQCGVWLGLSVEVAGESEINEEELAWHNWVVKIFHDLRNVSVISDDISWRRISINFAACLEVKGQAARFSRLIGVSKKLISQWQHFENTPSFRKVLEICYAAGISPLQLMRDPASTRNAILAIGEHPRRPPVHHRLQVVNREEIREYLQAVLDGRKPSRAICQIERELGVSFRTIERIFPLECSLVSRQHKAQRAHAWRQRIAQACDEVRQVAPALHTQGIYPSVHRVKSQLSIPSMMRKPEVLAAWRAVLSELGLKE
jgi:transcriptional regulator with XRE-family HTH domain